MCLNGYVCLNDVDLLDTSHIYTIESITKNSDSDYTAKTSYTYAVAPDYTYHKNFTFTIELYNGNCVIDSIK